MANIIVSDEIAELLETMLDSEARDALGLGTAATKDTGTSPGQVVVVGVDGKLPAVNGSNLTGITGASIDAGTLLGRGASSGTGQGEPLTIGTGLTLTGKTLTAEGGGGGTPIAQAKLAGRGETSGAGVPEALDVGTGLQLDDLTVKSFGAGVRLSTDITGSDPTDVTSFNVARKVIVAAGLTQIITLDATASVVDDVMEFDLFLSEGATVRVYHDSESAPNLLDEHTATVDGTQGRWRYVRATASWEARTGNAIWTPPDAGTDLPVNSLLGDWNVSALTYADEMAIDEINPLLDSYSVTANHAAQTVELQRPVILTDENDSGEGRTLLFNTGTRNLRQCTITADNINITSRDTPGLTAGDLIFSDKLEPGATVAATGFVASVVLSTPGATYEIGTGVGVSGGSGSGLLVNILTVDGGGAIETLSINDSGEGYNTGDVVVIDGGDTGATLTVTVSPTLFTMSAPAITSGTDQTIFTVTGDYFGADRVTLTNPLVLTGAFSIFAKMRSYFIGGTVFSSADLSSRLLGFTRIGVPARGNPCIYALINAVLYVSTNITSVGDYHLYEIHRASDNALSFWIDGVQLGTDTAGASGTLTLEEMGLFMTGYIERVAVYNAKQTGQNLTDIRASFGIV